jgi:diguanylate cyclase (GGDEF)-like protein
VVLPSTDLTGAARLAETMRRAVEALAIAHEGSPFGVVTASFGAAEARPRDGTSPAELVAAADRALYAAKAAGRNRVAIA